MSGILSLARELLLIYRGEQVQQRSLFWNCIIIAFIISATALWVLEHKELKETQRQLTVSLDTSTPKLECEFGWISADMPSEDKSSVYTRIFTAYTVRNTGAPSVAKYWEYTIKLPGGRTVKGVNQTIPKSLTVKTVNGLWKYYEEDALYNKAYINPIQNGSEVSGILIFHLPGLTKDDVFTHGSMVTLSFKDVKGKQNSCVHEMTGKKEIDLKYLPGMKSPLG